MTEAPQFRLRTTWPDENANIFHVLNADGDTIARISYDVSVPDWQDRWSWFMSAFQYRNRPDFAGRCKTREEAMAAVKDAWPHYLQAMEEDGHMERVRREKLGVPTLMFFNEDEYCAAPAKIEALAGCLEGTIEEAYLSLWCDAVRHWEKRNPPA